MGLRSLLLGAPDGPAVRGRITWATVDALVRRLPAKTNLVVSKNLLARAPPHKRTRMGRSRGALAQYRCRNATGNLHVKEFDRHWVVHVDAFHPRYHPVRHLLVDHGYNRFLHFHEVFGALARAPMPMAA